MNEPDFPVDGRMPDGNITFQDVQFPEQEFDIRLLPSNLGVRYRAGTLTLVKDSKPRASARSEVMPNAVIWAGPVADARFVFDTEGGLHTIRDQSGRELWSNASERPAPDLQLQRNAHGQAALIDTGGTTLWSGYLEPSASEISSHEGGAGQYTINAAGVQIKGDKGAVSVTADDGTHLWSGTLPVRPVLLVRDNRRFVFRSPDRSESGGFDKVIHIRFEAEVGKVTIADRNHISLGSQPIEMSQTFTAFAESLEEALGAHSVPADDVRGHYNVPRPTLAADGTVFLTYEDSSGRIICRAKSHKEGRSAGFSSRG